MASLQSILTPDCTLCAVSGTSKKRILEQISALAAEKLPEHTTYTLLDSLLTREKVGSTGIGNGIAIPHGRLTDNDNVVAILVTTEQAIDFDAIDNRPVDIFIALFVPEESCQQHLSTLQSIAKLFSDKQTCKQVRQCKSDQELFAVIQSIAV